METGTQPCSAVGLPRLDLLDWSRRVGSRLTDGDLGLIMEQKGGQMTSALLNINPPSSDSLNWSR